MAGLAAGYRHVRLGPLAVRVRPRAVGVGLGLLLLLLATAAFALARGSLVLPTREVIAVLLGQDAPKAALHIVADVRLPRVLLALLAGGMLGLAGATMQSLTRNGLADPGLIGVKEGASIGVLAVLFLAPHVDPALRPLAGLAGGLVTALIVCALARDLSGLRFILLGIGMSWLLSAGLLVFLTTADVNDVETALVWLAGSLHGAAWPTLPGAALWGGGGLAVLAATARGADALLLGRGAAIGLGVRPGMLDAVRLAAAVLMTAAAVSAVGNLGFVGLMAPHAARLLLGGGQAGLLAGSALVGALMVLAADTLGRLAFAPLQIPAGIVMAVCGVPVFLFMLWLRRDRL
ncbi:iron complex transport system permease protein [Azorhizobium sp. AG788]|uniref:FecCD family ABC transporter permease n=1 Tax=Azorhizobium sp. AG788 TaxID=2183897 RepID=UPI00105B8A47|nr:iron ABC transporter permease [Azorhizobium sp. AG788]TDT96807.1 iron complex transport system permease protein [Azorhizobium sp. AG788]